MRNIEYMLVQQNLQFSYKFRPCTKHFNSVDYPFRDLLFFKVKSSMTSSSFKLYIPQFLPRYIYKERKVNIMYSNFVYDCMHAIMKFNQTEKIPFTYKIYKSASVPLQISQTMGLQVSGNETSRLPLTEIGVIFVFFKGQFNDSLNQFRGKSVSLKRIIHVLQLK